MSTTKLRKQCRRDNDNDGFCFSSYSSFEASNIEPGSLAAVSRFAFVTDFRVLDE